MPSDGAGIGRLPAGIAAFGQPSLEWRSAGASDVGRVRRLNEDAWIERPEIGLWAVADGMGGHQAGDFASRTIIDNLAALPDRLEPGYLLPAVERAIGNANAALLAAAGRREPGTVIGSTVVALLARSGRFVCVWAGDSRLYRWRGGALVQLSRDHSRVQDMIDAGLLSAEAAERHPLANVVTRAVGVQRGLVLDQVTDEIRDGDVFLLYSDGLSKMLSDGEIAGILVATPLAEQPAALIAAALARGGRDNVTAVTVGISRPPR